MGAKPTTSQQANSKELQINHPMFSLARQIKQNNEVTLIRNVIHLASKQQFDEWHKKLSDLPENENLMLPIEAKYDTEGLCGTSGVAIISYHNYPYLLSDEINNRKSMNNRLFQENELWYLIYTILSAAATYHQVGIKTGDIRPDNIFINENGQVKVASINSWPGQQTNYAKSFFEKKVTYHSPEQIRDYQFGKLQQSSDKELCESFSIGLTALDAATLSDSKDLYMKNFKLSYENLQKKIKQLESLQYSEVLTLTIQSLCEVDADYRAKSRQIFTWLQPFEQEIANLQDFDVKDVPNSMKVLKQRNEKQKSQQKTNTEYNYPPSIYVSPQAGLNNRQLNFSMNNTQLSSFPIYYQVPPPQPATTYNLGFGGSSYSQGQTAYTQPSNYGVTMPSAATNGYADSNINAHKFTLQKIDEQLQISKRMFPQ